MPRPVRVAAGLVRDPVTGRVRPLEDEDSWMTWVRDLAQRRSWMTYHTLRSKGSEPGFPDLVLVRPPRLVFVELKTDSPRSGPSREQRDWLDALDAVANGGGRRHRTRTGYPIPETYIWRPRDRDLITAALW